MRIGTNVYGLGALALGLIGLVWGDFALVWQPVPADIPGRTALAYAVAAALALAGGAVNLRPLAAYGAAALTILYGLCVTLLHVPLVAAHPLEISGWAGVAEQLAVAAGGLVAYAACGGLDAVPTGRLDRIGRLAFGLCLVMFGVVHFRYLAETAAMVPSWLPPGQKFWAAATGIAHVAAGLAILSGFQARLAAWLVTLMFAGFGVLVHAPLLLADSGSHLNWVMNAINLVLTGAAWVVADSLGERR
jgi:uncharacterized membrane protein YphA (DoxX/SURF4 family)